MSIHKSKGLEFPVVFLCGLSRRFNREDLKAQVLCHRELGLGLSVVDGVNRMRYPTIGKRAIAAKLEKESLSEELRVLYVAMTRARDRLVMTYADQHLQSTLSDIALRMDLCPGELMTRDVSCPGEWILQTAMSRMEAGALFQIAGRPGNLRVSDHPWLIEVNAVASDDSSLTANDVLPEDEIGDTAQRMARYLRSAYPYEAATRTPSKQTATQQKGRQKDDEAAENTPAPPRPARDFRKPSFRDSQSRGRLYGNAVHTLMHYIHFEACVNTAGVEQERARLLEEGYLTHEQAMQINCQHIAAFFQTELGAKLRSGGENVLREFKFSILDDAEKFDASLAGEKILLQGVVDCALIEPDGITVVDFKTDFLTEETVAQAAERYRKQVEIYGDALSRIYGMKLKGKFLYFFHLNQFIAL